MTPLKTLVRKFVPVTILDRVYRERMSARTRREFDLDRARYARFMNPEDRVFSDPMTVTALETQATKDYHRIEKALALAAPKRPFGKELARRLDLVIPQIDEEAPVKIFARTARLALDDWNDRGIVSAEVSPIPTPSKPDWSNEEIARFFRSRHSVRHFDINRSVSRETLTQAVELAACSPSVCNRQAWRIHIADTNPSVREVLSHQNGNRGFGDVPAVAIITADARMFAGPGERNQGWIDGALFAMSFTWALHGLGLSSCMLNMSTSNSVADRLRTAVGIPAHELIITMIAVGYPASDHRVARSPRRSVDRVLRFL